MKEIVVRDKNEQFAEVVSMILQTKVIRVANASLIDLYWRVGNYISDKISISEWGDSFVNQFAEYIEKNNPDVKGFSNKIFWRMKQFYETYKDVDEKTLNTAERNCTPDRTLKRYLFYKSYFNDFKDQIDYFILRL